MIVQCMKCGWTQFAAGQSIVELMKEDHLLDDRCDGILAVGAVQS